MTPSEPVGLSPSLIDAAVAACRSGSWESRAAAILSLAGNADDPRVSAQLVASMEDEDSGVGTEAAGVLARYGGLAGLREVVELLSHNDDNLGYHIEYRLMAMASEGFPILERLRAIATTETDDHVRQCAEELADRAQSFAGK